ncbi:MAG TPA: hypothetical protein VFZ73_08865, partial [Gemmatimonadaceae bacterium]
MPKRRLTSRNSSITPAMSKRASRRTAPANRRQKKSPASVVTLRAVIANRVVAKPMAATAPIIPMAEEWNYLLRSRARWVDHGSVRGSLRERALADLELLGFKRAFIRRLATVEHIEVELHPVGQDAANVERYEAAAGFPWEYLLSTATRAAGRFQRLLITRLIRNDRDAVRPPPPGRVLFVESAPGRLYDQYDFESERKRIAAAVRATQEITDEGKRVDPMHFSAAPDSPDGTSRDIRFVLTETARRLKRIVQSEPWEAVHLTGVDTHQAPSLVPGFYDAIQDRKAIWTRITDGGERVRDGVILRESNVSELPVPFDDLAALLINPKQPPNLVTLNLYHSGARIARELV